MATNAGSFLKSNRAVSTGAICLRSIRRKVSLRAACSREIEMVGSFSSSSIFRCRHQFVWLNILSGFLMCLRVSSRFSGCLNELNVLQLLGFFLFLVQALSSSWICLGLWLPSSFQLGHVS